MGSYRGHPRADGRYVGAVAERLEFRALLPPRHQRHLVALHRRRHGASRPRRTPEPEDQQVRQNLALLDTGGSRQRRRVLRVSHRRPPRSPATIPVPAIASIPTKFCSIHLPRPFISPRPSIVLPPDCRARPTDARPSAFSRARRPDLAGLSTVRPVRPTISSSTNCT
jgi:hypothetical protein